MELGWCDTALVLPYAAIQILYPGIADRYGPKRVLVCCLALAGLTTLATYSAPSLFFFMVGLVTTGALLAPCWPACTKILGLWSDQHRHLLGRGGGHCLGRHSSFPLWLEKC